MTVLLPTVCPSFICKWGACVKVPTASQGQAVWLCYANIDPWSCKVCRRLLHGSGGLFLVTTCWRFTKEDGGFQRQVRGCHCAGTAYRRVHLLLTMKLETETIHLKIKYAHNYEDKCNYKNTEILLQSECKYQHA